MIYLILILILKFIVFIFNKSSVDVASTYFTFLINAFISSTDPYYIIDFGDGTPIDFPKQLNLFGGSLESHIYQYSGVFNVNITVYNEINSISVQQTVLKKHL
jgi:hypothetical protein